MGDHLLKNEIARARGDEGGGGRVAEADRIEALALG